MPQRSPINFWLLLAATICVDAVVVIWVSVDDIESYYSAVLLDALLFSQLSAACIWATFAARRWLRNLVVLIAVCIVIAIATAVAFDFPIADTFAIFGGYTTWLVILLWVVKHSKYFPVPSKDVAPTWQFSTAQLLGLMTVIGVLIAFLRRSEYALSPFLAVNLTTTGVLVATILVIWVMPWHIVMRLASSLSLAMLFGLARWIYSLWQADPLFPIGVEDLPIEIAHVMILTLVILAWMEWGLIIPERSRAPEIAEAGAART